MVSLRVVRALAGCVGIVAGLATTVPAAAAISGPCDGSITTDGVTYGPDNDGPTNPIVVRRLGIAEWKARTGLVIKDPVGSIGVVVGPTTIEVADWAGDDTREKRTGGTFEIQDAAEKLPVDLVGIYEVTGYHRGQGGECSGSVMIEIEGNPLGTVPGAAGVALTVLSGTAMLAAGVSRLGRR